MLTAKEKTIVVNLLADKLDDLHESIQLYQMKGYEDIVEDLEYRYEVYEQILLKIN